MEQKIYNVLFLCTGNSSRSIMAEALLNVLGKGRFRAYSAGSHPAGEVNQFATQAIEEAKYPKGEPRSKSWDEFAGPDAPHMDFVITVCDRAAGEVCPVWPGQPVTAHWGFQDPGALIGTDEEVRLEFKKILRQIKTRLDIFLNLPLEKLERMAIKQELDRIGKTNPGAESLQTISHNKKNATMTDKVYNVLFVCTGNSARSVMSEALVTMLGEGRFKGFSAGSKPGGRVNPFAVEQIQSYDLNYPVDQLRSKSWDEFARPDAPHMDFIITVCDNAAGEACPFWPGHPASAHWGFEDPAALEGTDEEKRALFAKVFRQIMNKIDRFVRLPIETMEPDIIRRELQQIGEMPVTSE